MSKPSILILLSNQNRHSSAIQSFAIVASGGSLLLQRLRAGVLTLFPRHHAQQRIVLPYIMVEQRCKRMNTNNKIADVGDKLMVAF